MQRLTDPRPRLGLGYSSWIEARIDAATKAHQAQKNRLEGRFLRLPGNTGEAWKVPTWCPGETRTQACSRRQALIGDFSSLGLLTFLLTFAAAGPSHVPTDLDFCC